MLLFTKSISVLHMLMLFVFLAISIPVFTLSNILDRISGKSLFGYVYTYMHL